MLVLCCARDRTVATGTKLVCCRVLSRIYRLGEKFRVDEGHELPGVEVVRGHAPPERFSNKYALRCNLVHFEAQSCHIVSLDREYLLHVQ